MPLSDEQRAAFQQAVQTHQQQILNPTPVLDQVSNKKPEDAAEEMRLQESTGLPPEAIVGDVDNARRIEKLQKFNLPDLPKRAPLTAGWLQEPKNAVVAQDDVDILAGLEMNVRRRESVSVGDIALTPLAGLAEGTGMGISGVGELWNTYVRSVNRAADVVLPEYFDRFLYQQENTPEILKGINRVTQFGEAFKYAGGNVKRTAEQLDLTPEERESLSYWQNVGVDVSKGVGQVTGQILTYLANPSLGVAQLLGQGAEQAAERQRESGTYGRDSAADVGVLAGAAITAGTEKIGIDTLLNRLPPNIRNRILRNIADVTVAGGAEALQEVSEGILHGINEMITTNPDAEIFEGLDREALAAGGTGMVVRAFINMLTPGRGGSPADQASLKDFENRLTSEASQDWLEGQIVLAQSAKVGDLSPEQFKEHLKSIDPEARVFLNADIASELEGAPQYIVDQLDNTGADVSISITDFLTDIARDEQMLAFVRPYIKIREDLKTINELEETGNSESVKRLIEKAEKHKEAKTEADMIYEQVKDQIVGSRRQGEHTARLSAELIPAYITTKHAELQSRGVDVSVRELYEKMGLRIVGPKGDVSAGKDSKVLMSAEEQSEYDRAVAKGLPMDEEARLGRAREQGYDTNKVWYHANRGGIGREGFDNKRLPSHDPDAPFNAHWFSHEPDMFAAYRNQQNIDPTITPVYVNRKSEAKWSDIMRVRREMVARGEIGASNLRQALVDAGYTHTIFEGHEHINEILLSESKEVDFKTARGKNQKLKWKTLKVHPSEPEFTTEEQQAIDAYHSADKVWDDYTKTILEKALGGSLADASTESKEKMFEMYNKKEDAHEKYQQAIDAAYMRAAEKAGAVESLVLFDELIGEVTGYESLADFLRMEPEEGTLAVFDPSKIRSIHAAFDPDFTGSANILAQEQDFGDIKLTDEVDGNMVTVEAQRAWDYNQKRLAIVERLRECLG